MPHYTEGIRAWRSIYNVEMRFATSLGVQGYDTWTALKTELYL
jgi:hypothetical protein